MNRIPLITHPDAQFSQEKVYRFRKTFYAAEPRRFTADVFADARYKLYLNGSLISVGPCKGNRSDRYFNRIDLTKHLRSGENQLEALVLQLKNEYDGPTVYANLCSVLRTGNLRFALQGTVLTKDGPITLETDETWLTACPEGITFLRDEDNTVGLNEAVESSWFAEQTWVKARVQGHCVHYESRKDNPTQRGTYSLKPAPIPEQLLEPIDLRFDGSVCDGGQYLTAYLKFVFSGKGTVKLTYAECRTMSGDIRKADRTDPRGALEGYTDSLEVDGQRVVYEPFWFRAFRFIRVEVTGDVKLLEVSGLRTGYPLAAAGSFFCDSQRDNALWQVSLRTLQCCMHETYEDCPYYEQEQYLMDSRLEALYTYQVSGDDRMVRRLFQDFAAAQYADGMLRSRTPDILPQIIPGYALYYIFMLYEHYQRFADRELLKSFYPVALGVIRYFSQHLSEKGLVKRSAFWDYVDWTPDWTVFRDERDGSPLAEGREEITVYTLMYVAALRNMARLTETLGDPGGAAVFDTEAERIAGCIRAHCFDREKMLFADGPSRKHFSAHGQIWAVLSDTVDAPTATAILTNSLALTTQPTYCYIFDYFRALEKAGLYGQRREMMDALRNLIDLHCTTVPEKPLNPRSECHAWNAVALYEFAAADLGVRVVESEKTLYIQPYIQDLTFAEGTVALKEGVVRVSWRKEPGCFTVTVAAPEAYTKKITLPDGSGHTVTEKQVTLTCRL